MRILKSKIHFVGIGGVGMCGLAELLYNMGAQVSGSDLSNSKYVERLKGLGVDIVDQHIAGSVHEKDVVVYSSAIPKNNVELVEARKNKIPVIARAEALAEIMRLKKGLAIAGTHGKTSTTSLAASVFLAAKADPTIVVGGKLDLIKSTALLGKGQWMIAEADESDGSFHRLSPESVIITNIDNDHVEHYGSWLNLKLAFFNFAQSIPFYGKAIVFGDDKETRELFKDFPKNILFYGFSEGNDYSIKGERGRYKVFKQQNEIAEFNLKLLGRHNALNALAAFVAGVEADYPVEACVKGVNDFIGVDRRFEWKAEHKSVDFYDDYAHHPTEVKCTLQAFKEKYPDRPIKAFFQPHRYSRFQSCWQDFCESFSDCDQLFVADVYPAGETPIATVDAPNFIKEVKHNCCMYVDRSADWKSQIWSSLNAGDVFVTLGAGDIWQLGEELYESR